MKRYFNTTGLCKPDRHYMVPLGNRLEEIREMIGRGEYFTVNRARQYGKTTLFYALAEYLKPWYVAVSLDFQLLSQSDFASEAAFSAAFAREIMNGACGMGEVPEKIADRLKEIAGAQNKGARLGELFACLSNWCAISQKPVVLLVDEVDNAANNRVFLDFLSMLRGYYLRRDIRPIFQSVILAGVYDIKNWKLKLRPQEEHQYNSPWNIAADFDVHMAFSQSDIEKMLESYELDHRTGMDVHAVAGMLYDYTSGYPFLVSRLCKLIDEKLEIPGKPSAWGREGVLEAVRLLLEESNTLFDDMRKKLSDYPDMRRMLYELLYEGQSFPYNTDDELIDIARMFGYIKGCEGKVMVSNRIFETRLYNLFVSEERRRSAIYTEGSRDRNLFIRNGRLDMRQVLERFVVHFTELYGDSDEKFLEKSGRKFFLFFLKPIINGTGNYYVEAQTRNEERTDVIVDYLGEQYIVELKIWRGNAYHERGERQLLEYLDAYQLKKGYMLSFNFNQKKEVGVKELRFGEKVLIEAVV